MDLIRLAIRQPVTIAVGVILIILAGIISLSRLPIQLTPNVESTVITVSTFWEGASPEEVEENIIDKQEERLLSLSDLVSITSASAQNFGSIRLEFRTGTDKNEALREVSDKLREVPDYPENVDEPIVSATDRESRDYIAWIMFGTTDPDFDIRTMRDFAIDRIEPALERTPGVAAINVLGGREREAQVRFDPVRLAQYGVTPAQFASVLRGANQNISAGERADGKLDVRVRTIGQFASVTEVEDTVIQHTSGGPVLVRDVATVVETFKDPTSFVRSRGEPVIAINAERELGSNVIEVMDLLTERIDQLNATGGLLETEADRLGLNGTLYLRLVYDQTGYIEDALSLVRNNIWIGGILATIVLLLFLRSVRSVGIIALAIPISVIGAVVVMVALGRSINVISLAGMAFAVGMVVDNAIVVLENIFRHLEMGKPARRAAYEGAREVWGAVLASTLTTIVVFIPILLVQEQAGQLFRDIALAICAAVALSLLVSITLIPTTAARLLHQNGKKKKTTRDGKPRGVAAMLSGLIYWICGSVLARLGAAALLTAVSVAGTLVLMPDADYLPSGNRNLVFGMIIPPPGYNIHQMEDIALRIEETIGPFWEAAALMDDPEAYEQAVAQLPQVPTFDMSTFSFGPPMTPPPIENYFLVQFENILFHGGVSAEPVRAKDMMPLMSHATRADVVPGAMSFPFQVPLFQLGGSTGSAIKLELRGPDLDSITASAGQLMGVLAGQQDMYQSVQPAPSNFAIPNPEIQVLPDLVRLSELGLTTADVGMAVRAMGDGAIIDEYRIGGEAIDLKVIAEGAVGQRSFHGLADLPIAIPRNPADQSASRNGVVPLGSIATIARMGGPQEIARSGRQRAITFQITPHAHVPLEEAIRTVEETVEAQRQAGVIPPTIEANIAGSASKLEEVRHTLLGDGSFIGTISSSLVLALLVVYLLMCVLFQSFMKPLVIMFSVPLATLGGFAALWAVALWSASDWQPYMPDQKLDILTMLGFVLLIGVVVNNAILIVHQTLNFLTGAGDVGSHFKGEMTPRRAIAEAVRTRVRPIFMGTFTSVGGMLPLVLMPGSGSELYRGLGSVVVGGLIVSTIFTLLLVPVLLSLVFDIGALFGAKPAPAAIDLDEVPTGGAVSAQPALRRSVDA